MIPLKLSVRNFLCYRDNVPTLDFEGIHIACLCGDNGHGKTALLDAITWCLWGQARTGGRNHDALITHGEDECRVELDFQSRGQNYRAIRRRRRSGRGQTQLDLFVLGDTENPRTLTANTVIETNAKIKQIVGMDYDTFVNSAFLLQGRSDEFMRKTPGERKDTLSSILGLDLYDTLQAAARAVRDRHRIDLAHHTEGLQQSRNTLASIPDPADELQQVGAQVDALSGELAQAAVESERLRAAVEQLGKARAEMDGVVEKIGALQTGITELDADASATQKRITTTRLLANQADEISHGVSRLAQTRDQLRLLEAARAQYDQLQSQRAELQRAIDHATAQHRANIDELARRIQHDLEPLAGRADAIASELAALEGAESEAAREQVAINALAAGISQMQQQMASNDVELNRCVEEGKTLRSRLVDMQSADAVCPLCGTPLADDACDNITGYYQSELDIKLRLHQELTTANAELTQSLETLNAETDQRSRALTRKQRDIQRARGRLEQEQRQCAEAAQQLEAVLPQLKAAQQVLATRDFADEERRQVAEIDQQLADLGYDDFARRETFDLIQSLQHWEPQQIALNLALAALPQDEANLQRIEAQSVRWREELRAAQQRLAADQAAVMDLPNLQKQSDAAQQAVVSLRTAIDAASQRRGYLLAAVESRRQAQAEIERLTSLRSLTERELDVYSELFTAFGRGGVPAMLIDGAVPRIETEATTLLGRMTDNRMAVKLETQRTTNAGGVSETLDILISDELGTRSYEVFSGGEVFRINLALRIALSKVLSQRMGVPLPTLFIDEGFGTQDAAGRERIVDTINSIQDQFEKIIVITHLEDLKNLFDVHIQVEKFDTGSQFELVVN